MKTTRMKIIMFPLFFVLFIADYTLGQQYGYIPGEKYLAAEKEFLEIQREALDYLDRSRSQKLITKKRSLSMMISRKINYLKNVNKYSDNPKKAAIYQGRADHQQNLINNLLAGLASYHEIFEKFKASWLRLFKIREEDVADFYRPGSVTAALEKELAAVREKSIPRLRKNDQRYLKRLYRQRESYQRQVNGYLAKGPKFYNVVSKYKDKVAKTEKEMIRILCKDSEYKNSFERYSKSRQDDIAREYNARKGFYDEWRKASSERRRRDSEDGLE